ncbi:MAG: SDR family oxidoreductase [Okeania sp. SIO3I5]|uniref:SDR family oxidoreductase n=1 Tax=Okeania sp. SIO3I5 TaxID=2607805 RepID=UPI0013B6FA22|nr:SDR family oxidoreductase [Okeania sp. SIO3I5]NEQ39379.1 SDR family oxidoreductase [Okeania sp. SIO3I5]
MNNNITEQQTPEQNQTTNILVLGATGGVGQIVVAKLIAQNYQIIAIVRDIEKAQKLFGDSANIKIFPGDVREQKSLEESLANQQIDATISCLGTTAFPSTRWWGGNNPKNTDYLGNKNLINLMPTNLKRFILVSSVGVERSDQFPYKILNLFGVLDYKLKAEKILKSSGLPYTIIRPGRLTDGPYTSYDLNTLIKATSGNRQKIIIGQGDKLLGETSRIIVAEACVEALQLDCTINQTFEIINQTGKNEIPDNDKSLFWQTLFTKAQSNNS